MTEKELYTTICRKAPSLVSLFAQSWWLDATCDAASDWEVALSMKGDTVAGAWPFLRSERFGLSMMRNPRLTPYLGPQVFFPPDIASFRRDAYEYEVCEQLMAALPDADLWRLALPPGFKQAGLMRRSGLQLSVQQSFLLSLKADEDVLFGNFKESLRRNLRAGEKEIRIVDDHSQLDQLFAFQKSTLDEKRVKQTHSLGQMQRLMSACQEHQSGTLWLAYEGEKLQAALWNVWDTRRSYYLMGAKSPDCDNYRAMSALLWHCIRQAKARGNEFFDFEGSMDGGVERFFRSFSAQRELYLVLRREGHWLWKLARLLHIR